MTTIKLYNAFTDRVEPIALEQEPVTLYVCGITPYDTTHLGHAFTYAVADHLIRFLEYLGHTVKYVQNVTDIDDDILRKAQEVGEDWKMLGNRWTLHFSQDLQRLNMRPPDHFPRATDFIPQMVEGIERLVAKGAAYESNGSVYYQAATWPRFGTLAGLSEEELLPTANERGNNADDPNKRAPLDFPLWQAQQPGEPAWDSPWGPGRPGWHIECSTMATELLGDTIDFHGGGSDLGFPHHECEIAQSETMTGEKPFVRHWFHAAMVEYEGEKMSKSLGNLIMVSDLLEDFSADALRLYLASSHYRRSWPYQRLKLEEAAAQAQRWSAAASLGNDTAEGNGTAEESTRAPYELPAALTHRFIECMADDLDTPGAVQALDTVVQALEQAAAAGKPIGLAQEQFVELASVLGLRLTCTLPHPAVIQGWNRHMRHFSR